MVCTGEGPTERDCSDRAATFIAMGPERSNHLHNFSLPRLRWGGQRHMRCVKIDSPYDLQSPSPAPGPEPSPSRTVSGDERWRSGCGIITRLSAGDGIDCDGDIEAVREKFLTDLRDEMDKIRANCLSEGAKSGEAAEPVKEENTVRPWNLRTRRANRRAPVGGSDGEIGNGYLISLLKPSLRSGAEKMREERTKFCPTLTRKEVEDDFMKMTGQRPPRTRKKRPRAVQKQLDMLFPGFWLMEVTVDTYKVPEIPDNAKR